MLSPSRAEVAVATASACLALALAALGWRALTDDEWAWLRIDTERSWAP